MDTQNAQNIPPKRSKNFILWLIILGLVALLVVAFAYIETQKVVSKSASLKVNWQVSSSTNETSNGNTSSTTAPVDLTNAAVVLPGASLITKDEKVVNDNGKVADNMAIPSSPNAPRVVEVKKEDLPKQVLDLSIGNGKITPNTFTVLAGKPITLAVSSVDNKTHVFIFTNEVVGAIAMGVDGGVTRAVTFNAPTTPGEYHFQCDVPGHKDLGETGKMIVK